MNWKTPAEEMPERDAEIIVAWMDGEVTYLSRAHAANWDYAKYWSYMPEHPDTKVAQNSTSTQQAKVKICPLCGNKMAQNDEGKFYCVGWPWCTGKGKL